MSTGLRSFLDALRKSISLPSSVSRGCLHSLACGLLPASKPSVVGGVFLTLHHSDTESSASASSFKDPCDYPGLPKWLSGKESACNAGDMGSILGLGRSPGEGNGTIHPSKALTARLSWQRLLGPPSSPRPWFAVPGHSPCLPPGSSFSGTPSEPHCLPPPLADHSLTFTVHSAASSGTPALRPILT